MFSTGHDSPELNPPSSFLASTLTHNYTSMMAISSAIDPSTDGSGSYDQDDDADQCREREREVSSVGNENSPMSRSSRRRAKKERRQKAKEGDVEEAFVAGSFLGKSSNDTSMQEILVRSIRAPGVVAPDTWAAPILEPNKTDSTTASSRSSLRKGKRDLLRSWFATPEANGDVPVEELPPPVIHHHSDSVAECRSPVSEGLMLLSGSGYAPTAEGAFGEEPWELSASLGSVASSTHSTARHSRPRDTIRSIQALRESASTTTSNYQLDEADRVPLPDEGRLSTIQQINDGPVNNRRLSATWVDGVVPVRQDQQHQLFTPPTLDFESQAAVSKEEVCWTANCSFPSDNDTSFPTITSHSLMATDKVPPPGVLGETTTDLTTGLSSLQVSGLKVVKGSKGRNTVSFNEDVYNLSTWDSDDLGPFVLTNSTKAVSDEKSAPLMVGAGWSGVADSSSLQQSSNNFNSSSQVYSQSSNSVLTTYFQSLSSLGGVSGGDPSNEPPSSLHARAPLVGGTEGNSFASRTNVLHHTSSAAQSSSIEFQLPHVPVGASGLRRVNSLFAEGHLSKSSQSAFCTSSPIIGARRNTADIPDYKCREYLSQLGQSHLQPAGSSSVGPASRNQSIIIDGGNQHFGKRPPSSESQVQEECPFHVANQYVSGSESLGSMKSISFSDVVGKYVTVDTLVHKAISYTEQLASPPLVSGVGNKKFRQE